MTTSSHEPMWGTKRPGNLNDINYKDNILLKDDCPWSSQSRGPTGSALIGENVEPPPSHSGRKKEPWLCAPLHPPANSLMQPGRWPIYRPGSSGSGSDVTWSHLSVPVTSSSFLEQLPFPDTSEMSPAVTF